MHVHWHSSNTEGQLDFYFRMFPPLLWGIKVKNYDFGLFHQLWSKIVVFQLLSLIKRVILQNIEYVISTLCFNSHDVHAYQFEGQLKIFQRLDTIFAQNIIELKDPILLVKIQLFHPNFFHLND